MNEEWRPVPGYEEHYEISSLGYARCVKPNRDRDLKRNENSRNGTYFYVLSLEGKIKTFSAARLVCLAFHGPAKGRRAQHISTNLNDDSVGNVRWSDA